eukprot:15408353-Alexandrium_andersonii.AAC.1
MCIRDRCALTGLCRHRTAMEFSTQHVLSGSKWELRVAYFWALEDVRQAIVALWPLASAAASHYHELRQ